MSFNNISTSLKFFSLQNRLKLLSFFARKKLNAAHPFPGDPKILDRYNKVFFLHEKGVTMKSAGKNKMILSFTLNGKNLQAAIRPRSSDIDVFISVILQEEYKSATQVQQRQGCNLLIIDAGANIGFTTLYFHAYFPHHTIICIEPDPENFELLSENIRINNISNCKVLSKAIWTEITTLQLHNQFRDGEAWAKSIIPMQKKVAGTYAVETCTIGQILDTYKGYPITIFKMDIEGAEGFLFNSPEFVQQLTENTDNFIIEIHDEFNLRPDIYEKMTRHSYTISEHEDVTLFTKMKPSETISISLLTQPQAND